MKDHCQKLSTHLRFYNKKQHHKNIIQAKKGIDFKRFQKQLKQYACVSANHKYQNTKNREIEQSNLRLFNRITQIKSRRIKTEPEVEPINKRFNSLNLYDSNAKIYEDNIKLVNKLDQVRPAVGTRKQWDLHAQKAKQLQKNITRYRRNKYASYEKQLQQFIISYSREHEGKQRRRLSSLSNKNQSHHTNTSKRTKNTSPSILQPINLTIYLNTSIGKKASRRKSKRHKQKQQIELTQKSMSQVKVNENNKSKSIDTETQQKPRNKQKGNRQQKRINRESIKKNRESIYKILLNQVKFDEDSNHEQQQKVEQSPNNIQLVQMQKNQKEEMSDIV